jgi:hypothetical protein
MQISSIPLISPIFCTKAEFQAIKDNSAIGIDEDQDGGDPKLQSPHRIGGACLYLSGFSRLWRKTPQE